MVSAEHCRPATSGGGGEASKLLLLVLIKDIVGTDAAWNSGKMVWIEELKGQMCWAVPLSQRRCLVWTDGHSRRRGRGASASSCTIPLSVKGRSQSTNDEQPVESLKLGLGWLHDNVLQCERTYSGLMEILTGFDLWWRWSSGGS